MKGMKKLVGVILLFMGVFSACLETDPTKSPKPPSFGKINTIQLITDEDLWDSSVKDSFEYYFASAYPIMPSPEPIFNIRYLEPGKVMTDPLLRQLRCYILLADVSNPESPATRMLRSDLGEEKFQRTLTDPDFNSSIGANKWARDQIFIYLFGNGQEALEKSIRKNYPAVAQRINEFDNKQLHANTFPGGENRQIQNEVLDLLGFNIKVPSHYKKVLSDEEFPLYWFRRDTKDAIINMTLSVIPYISESQFSMDSIIAYRDRFGAEFISSAEPGSYMLTHTEFLPVFEYSVNIGGNYTRELRGTWEMENDFKGGPFFTYLILDQNRSKLIFIDCFVFAPGGDKRDYMQQLEHIAHTVRTL
jgi:hypothetical protein